MHSVPESLYSFRRKVHIKVPCAQCGELVGSSIMGLHIRSKHTPYDEMKYNCDICGKGFVNKGNFKDHTYTHMVKNPINVNSAVLVLLVEGHMLCMKGVILVISVANGIS